MKRLSFQARQQRSRSETKPHHTSLVRGYFMRFRTYIRMVKICATHRRRATINPVSTDLIGVLAEKEMTLASSKDTPKRIEARFKREERAQEGAQAMLEYVAEGRAVREKTARLRALRLAAEA